MSLASQTIEIAEIRIDTDRREFRRHDMAGQDIEIDRLAGDKRRGNRLGKIMDLSAGGIRILTTETHVRPEQQIRLCIDLPAYAGISPFVQQGDQNLEPTGHWVGWMLVTRVVQIDDDHTEIAGRLVDMNDCNRGMLGLYLSTQPMAA